MQDTIKITFYEPWMKPQIAALFEQEYGIKKSSFEAFMTRLYEHPIQEKSIKLVALDGEKVVGFQSFFYWPYVLNNVAYNSYQSGNSLTHPDYRGKGIFKKLLNFVFENANSTDADFFIGFPVQASYGSFIKNKWENSFNLIWYLKVLNPFACLFGRKKLAVKFSNSFMPELPEADDRYTLSQHQDFYAWKNDLKEHKADYFYHTYHIDQGTAISFEMKFQVRKKIIQEVIIGKVYFKGHSKEKLKEGINDLLKNLKASRCVTICSIAINEYLKTPDYKTALQQLGFKKIDKKIYFIVKPIAQSETVSDREKWDIGRADIDTW